MITITDLRDADLFNLVIEFNTVPLRGYYRCRCGRRLINYLTKAKNYNIRHKSIRYNRNIIRNRARGINKTFQYYIFSYNNDSNHYTSYLNLYDKYNDTYSYSDKTYIECLCLNPDRKWDE